MAVASADIDPPSTGTREWYSSPPPLPPLEEEYVVLLCRQRLPPHTGGQLQ